MSRWVSLAEVAEINPRTPTPLRDRDGSQLVPFLPMSAVSEEGHACYQERRPIRTLLKGYTYFGRGDVLLAKITPCLENGKAALLDELPDDVGFGSTEFHVLRPGRDVDPQYLFYSVWNNSFRRTAERSFTGTAGQKRLPASFLETYKIPLPPLAEQRRIAAVLDKVDGIRRKQRESLRLVDEFLRSAFLEMFGDPLRNEKGWEVRRLVDVVQDAQYGTSQKANSDGRGTPTIRMNNLTPSGDIDLSELKWSEIPDPYLPKYTVRRGDVLFNRTNSPELVGKTAVWDRDEEYAFAGYLVRLRLDENRMLPHYLSGFLNSAYGKQLLFATARPSINMSNISASTLLQLRIPVPPLMHQKRYFSLIEAVREARHKRQEALNESERLFSALSQRLFRAEAEAP